MWHQGRTKWLLSEKERNRFISSVVFFPSAPRLLVNSMLTFWLEEIADFVRYGLSKKAICPSIIGSHDSSSWPWFRCVTTESRTCVPSLLYPGTLNVKPLFFMLSMPAPSHLLHVRTSFARYGNKGRKTEQLLAREVNASLKATHRSFYFISTSTRCLKECREIGL